jgi:hypothetical protein
MDAKQGYGQGVPTRVAIVPACVAVLSVLAMVAVATVPTSVAVLRVLAWVAVAIVLAIVAAVASVPASVAPVVGQGVPVTFWAAGRACVPVSLMPLSNEMMMSKHMPLSFKKLGLKRIMNLLVNRTEDSKGTASKCNATD